MRIVRALLATGGVTAIGGVALVSLHFSTESPWFYVGLTMCTIASCLFIGGMFRAQSTALDEEFEAGYRSGYEVGTEYAPRPPSLNVIRRGHGQARAHATPDHHSDTN